jgi:hypothetical protein
MNKDPEFMVDAKERQQAIERYAFLGLAVGTALLTESNFQGARRLASREGSKSAADEVVLEGQNTA